MISIAFVALALCPALSERPDLALLHAHSQSLARDAQDANKAASHHQADEPAGEDALESGGDEDDSFQFIVDATSDGEDDEEKSSIAGLDDAPKDDDDDAVKKLCFGCLYRDGCEPEATREECDLEEGIWHLEDRATALEDGEVAEFLSPTTLDLDEDGEIIEAELQEVFVEKFGQRSMTNASIDDIKKQLSALTGGPNLTEYMERMELSTGNGSSNASLIQDRQGRFWGAAFTVVTKAISFTTHVAKGGNVGQWFVNEAKDPWNYLGFVPGLGGASTAARTAARFGRYSRYVNYARSGYRAVHRGANYYSDGKTVYDTAGNVLYLTSQASHHHSGGYSHYRSSNFQPRPANVNCATQTGYRCGSSGRFAVCPQGMYCSRYGWCGNSHAHRSGHQYLYSNNYHSKCSGGSSSRSGNKCESQTGHRCGASTRGVCGSGRWCSAHGWCQSYYQRGNTQWSNNAGGVCR